MSKSRIKVGDAVPKFSLKNQNGELISIEKFIGKPFVIYFYPKDDTPGCTVEACAFRDTYEQFRKFGAAIIGISADSPRTHQKFAKKYELPFVLLSDTKNEVRKLFGVPKSLFGLLPGRMTYTVDEKGLVKHIFEGQFQAKKHVAEALESLKNNFFYYKFMKIKDLAAIKEREVFPGFFGKFVHSERLTVAHWTIKANSEVPHHSHPHEQIVHVLEGELELVVKDEKHRLTAGMVLVIPPNVPHSGVSLTDCKVIDTFCPVREDYL